MTEESPLDIALLDETFDTDEEGLHELLDMYWAQAEQTIPELHKAIQAGDAKSVDHLAHKLAGSSGVCGVKAMVGPLRTLEMRGRAGDLSDADSLIASLTECLESCRRLVDEYLASKGAAS